jgi:hypothetical protein
MFWLSITCVHNVLTLLVGTPSFQQHLESQCSCVWSGVKITESDNSMQLQLQARELVASQNIMFTYPTTYLRNKIMYCLYYLSFVVIVIESCFICLSRTYSPQVVIFFSIKLSLLFISNLWFCRIFFPIWMKGIPMSNLEIHLWLVCKFIKSQTKGKVWIFEI